MSHNTSFTCDGCKSAIKGDRYTCIACYNQDFCSDCEALHPHPHPVILVQTQENKSAYCTLATASTDRCGHCANQLCERRWTCNQCFPEGGVCRKCIEFMHTSSTLAHHRFVGKLIPSKQTAAQAHWNAKLKDTAATTALVGKRKAESGGSSGSSATASAPMTLVAK